MLELTLRLIASLAVVVGLLLLLARVAGRRFAGREGAAVQVLHRQALSRTASVAVLAVGSRILVVGTTDQQVRLLTELDPDDLAEDLTLVELDSPDVAPATRPPVVQGSLAGSVLSRETWRQALAVATRKAS